MKIDITQCQDNPFQESTELFAFNKIKEVVNSVAIRLCQTDIFERMKSEITSLAELRDEFKNLAKGEFSRLANQEWAI